MCQEIVSAVNMPIPRYLSNSKICQKVPSSKLIFSMQYANNSIDLSIVFKKKPLAYMRIYRHVPKGMLVWLNMRADSVPLHRSKSRTYKLVDCIKDAKFNNRGKLLQSVVLHLRNKQLTKTNKARLSVVDLRKYKASIYLEKAKFRGLKVLNYILTTALTNVTTITQRRMYEVAVRPETQTWMGAIIMKDLVECLTKTVYRADRFVGTAEPSSTRSSQLGNGLCSGETDFDHEAVQHYPYHVVTAQSNHAQESCGAVGTACSKAEDVTTQGQAGQAQTLTRYLIDSCNADMPYKSGKIRKVQYSVYSGLTAIRRKTTTRHPHRTNDE